MAFVKEKHRRSMTKSVIWRVVGIAFLALVTYAVTGNWFITTLVTVIHHSAFVVIYYLHERFWLWLKYFRESKWRPILRVLLYEIVLGNLVLGSVTWILTGGVKQVTLVTMIYIGNKVWMYIVYDKLWERAHWGRTEQLSPMIQQSLMELLLSIKSVLDAHKAKFWLDSGTLLGAMKNGSLLPWERDIDLGMWSPPNSLEASMAREFEDMGYAVLTDPYHMNIRNANVWADLAYYQLGKESAISFAPTPHNFLGKYLRAAEFVLQSPKHYKGARVYSPIEDIVLRCICGICELLPCEVREKGVRLTGKLLKMVGYSIWVVPIRYFSEFESVNLHGSKFDVPIHPEEYLVWRYGKDWRTPKRKWSDNAIVEAK